MGFISRAYIWPLTSVLELGENSISQRLVRAAAWSQLKARCCGRVIWPPSRQLVEHSGNVWRA